MKKILFTVIAVSALFAACNNETKSANTTGDSTNTTSNTNTEDTSKWVPVDSAVMMQKWAEFMTPGPLHKAFESWTGKWKGETTQWMSQGQPPMQSTMTAMNSTIMGGRYQVSEYSGEMMGQKFQGASMLGYNNATRKLENTWVDNMGTGIMFLTGDWDEATKTMSLSGEMDDFTRPGKKCKIRQTFKIVDDNNQLMEMYAPDPMTGKEYKSMEVKLTRVK